MNCCNIWTRVLGKVSESDQLKTEEIKKLTLERITCTSPAANKPSTEVFAVPSTYSNQKAIRKQKNPSIVRNPNWGKGKIMKKKNLWIVAHGGSGMFPSSTHSSNDLCGGELRCVVWWRFGQAKMEDGFS